MRLKFLIGATMALAAAALYYSILTAYTSKIVVVPVIKLLSATAATASAMTAASAGAALLLIVGALLLAYFGLFNPRPLPSRVVEVDRLWPWNPNFNHVTRNANGGRDYDREYTSDRRHDSSRNNRDHTTHTRNANHSRWFQTNHKPHAGHAATRSSQDEHYQGSRNVFAY